MTTRKQYTLPIGIAPRRQILPRPCSLTHPSPLRPSSQRRGPVALNTAHAALHSAHVTPRFTPAVCATLHATGTTPRASTPPAVSPPPVLSLERKWNQVTGHPRELRDTVLCHSIGIQHLTSICQQYSGSTRCWLYIVLQRSAGQHPFGENIPAGYFAYKRQVGCQQFSLRKFSPHLHL